MKNLLLVLAGVIIGGLAVFFLKPANQTQNLINPSPKLTPTSETVAKQMIQDFYSLKQNDTVNFRKLLRRSYRINADDIRLLLSLDSNKADSLRIYPIFKTDPKFPAGSKDYYKGNMISFIIMVQDKNKRMMRMLPASSTSQSAYIQDQLEPCPYNCGGVNNELYNSTEWSNLDRIGKPN